MSKHKNGYTITGPGVEKNGYESGAIALSAAITNARTVPEGAAIYVRRNSDDHVYGYVEHEPGGTFLVYRTGDR